MNKRAFTLVELIGVIAIIAILGILVVVPIINNMEKSNSNLSDTQIRVASEAFANFASKSDNDYYLAEGMVYHVPAYAIIDSGDFDNKFLNDYLGVTLKAEDLIKVEVVDNKYMLSIENENNYQTLEELITNGGSTYSYLGGTYSPNYSTIEFNGINYKILGKNSDGSIRLFATEAISMIVLSDGTSDYQDSYVREWLNNYYYNRLSNKEYIVDSELCPKKNDNNSDTTTTCSEQTIKDKVALISLVESNLLGVTSSTSSLYSAINSYITLTKTTTNTYHEINGTTKRTVPADELGNIRPVISLSADTPVFTYNDNGTTKYIVGKTIAPDFSGIKIGEANISLGTRIKLSNKDYVVVERNDEGIRIRALDPLTNTYRVAESIEYSLDYGLGKTLNTDFSTLYQGKENYLIGMTRNIGIYYTNGDNYKTTALIATNTIKNVKIALPKIGELFTIPLKLNEIIPTMTMRDENNAYIVKNNTRYSLYTINTDLSIYPVLNLRDDVTIKSGKGTSYSPFEI